MTTPSHLVTWLAATRPRTLAAGAAPVLVGTALGSTVTTVTRIDWLSAAACLVGAILIQIGSNFANDAFDGLKGADTPDRVGPQRAVASGLISARAMLIATGMVLALAFVIGLYLSTIGGWPILVMGVISLICAVAYTGGPYPLAYHGLGDLFVFLFFGLFAVLGSAWIQVATATWLPLSDPAVRAWITDSTIAGICIAAAVGLQATGIIAVNNLRDLATDATVGKHTLAVRFGDLGCRRYIVVLHVAATVLLGVAFVVLQRQLLLIPIAIAGCGGALLCHGLWRTTGRDLNRYLARSAGLELITAVALAVALMV